MVRRKTNRRNFLRLSGGFFITGLAISPFIPIISSCERDESLPSAPPGSQVIIPLFQHPELMNIPSIAKIVIQQPISIKLIVKRIANNNFIVFTNICPHQGEELDLPSSADGYIHCPKHQVDFSTTAEPPPAGRVVSNPLGVKVGNLPLFIWEFDSKNNSLIVKFS